MRALSGWAIGVWAVAFALLILGVAVATYNIDALRANDRAVDHSRNVRRSLSELVSAVKDAETGQRCYLLTGNPVYLEPFTKAETTVPERLARFVGRGDSGVGGQLGWHALKHEFATLAGAADDRRAVAVERLSETAERPAKRCLQENDFQKRVHLIDGVMRCGSPPISYFEEQIFGPHTVCPRPNPSVGHQFFSGCAWMAFLPSESRSGPTGSLCRWRPTQCHAEA